MSKKATQISAKYIVTTREFIENFLDMECSLHGYIGHDRMEEFVLEQGHAMPPRVNLDFISKEAILRGDFILVRSEGSRRRKKAPLVPYRNPHRQPKNWLEENMPADLPKVLQKQYKTKNKEWYYDKH